MRLSCNGCRVLRKGCSESCSIRACLQCIKSPDAQSNATVFLAKFYGRAGLLNLINAAAGPEEKEKEKLRPAVFRSLLYEACGRIVNPIYGSAGLLWSGNWHMCQAAVEAVLKGKPIVRISDYLMAATPATYYGIRHIVSDDQKKKKRKSSADDSSAAATTCNNKVKKPKKQQQHPNEDQDVHPSASSGHHEDNDHGNQSSLDSDDAEAGSHVSHAEHNHQQEEAEEQEQQQQMGLDLTLGFAPLSAPPTGGHRETATGTGWTAAEPGFAGFRFL